MKPANIKLKPEHSSQLAAMLAAEKGLQTFVQQVIDNGQRRATELEQKRIAFYTGTIAKDPDYAGQGLDMKAITYMPSPDASELVPAAQRYVDL